MRHSKARLQLNRFTSWRKATLVSLAKALIIQQRITTTSARAKAVRPLVDKLITLGKEKTLFAKRQAYRILGSHKLVSFLFSDIAPRFSGRVGGYTRIINLGPRRGDNASLVVFELSQVIEKSPKKPKPQKEIAEKAPEVTKEEPPKEEGALEKKPKAEIATKEKPPITKKPTKKFLGGLRGIFKRERDSL